MLEVEPEAVCGFHTNPKSGQDEVLIKWKGLQEHDCTLEWKGVIQRKFPMFDLEDKVNFKATGNVSSGAGHPPILYHYQRRKSSTGPSDN